MISNEELYSVCKDLYEKKGSPITIGEIEKLF